MCLTLCLPRLLPHPPAILIAWRLSYDSGARPKFPSKNTRRLPRPPLRRLWFTVVSHIRQVKINFPKSDSGNNILLAHPPHTTISVRTGYVKFSLRPFSTLVRVHVGVESVFGRYKITRPSFVLNSFFFF